MKLLTSISIGLCLAITPCASQSLRDLARQQGGSVTNGIDLDFGVEMIPALLSQADLVVHGRIIASRTRLLADESHVVTEYEVAPIRVVKQAKPMSVARPGETSRVLVWCVGGTLIENGYRLSTSVNAYPESETYKVGEEVVLFLQYRADTGAYDLSGGPFGAFRIQGGRVQPMTREVTVRRGDKPLDLAIFLDQLQRLPAR